MDRRNSKGNLEESIPLESLPKTASGSEELRYLILQEYYSYYGFHTNEKLHSHLLFSLPSSEASIST
jgi:hypothetical protein